MSYLAFAWIASVLYGLEVIVTKLVSKHAVANPWLFNFFWSLFIASIILPLGLYFGIGAISHWPSLLGVGLFYALTGVFYILALYSLDVSVLSPFFSVRTAISVVLGVFLLSEKLSLFQISLVLVVLAGGLLVTYDEKWSVRSLTTKPVGLAFTLMFVLSWYGVFVKKAIAANGFWVVTAVTPLIGQAFLLLTLPLFISEIRKLTRRNWVSLVLVAVVGTLGTLAANKAYETNVSISTVILSLPISMIAAFIFSVFAPQLLEKHSLKVYAVRFIAAAVMISAAVKLSFI